MKTVAQRKSYRMLLHRVPDFVLRDMLSDGNQLMLNVLEVCAHVLLYRSKDQN